MIESCILVIALHGASGNGSSMHTALGSSLPPSVEVVTPSSPTKVWDITANSYSQQQILTVARASSCDTKILVGHSNGAYMATALQCRFPRIFDGVFTVNGWANISRCPLTPTSQRLVIHGADDTLIPRSGQLVPPVSWLFPTRFWGDGKTTTRQVRNQTAGKQRFQRVRWVVRDGGHGWDDNQRLADWMRRFL